MVECDIIYHKGNAEYQVILRTDQREHSTGGRHFESMLPEIVRLMQHYAYRGQDIGIVPIGPVPRDATLEMIELADHIAQQASVKVYTYPEFWQ